MFVLQVKFDLFPIISTLVEPNRSNTKLVEFQSHFSNTCFCKSPNWSLTHWMAVLSSCILS